MTASAREEGAAALDAAPGAMPTMSNTAAEIRSYAESIGVKVGSKASKASMLSAIEEASRG